MSKEIFKTIQNTFSNAFEIILNNKYLKALFLTFLIIIFVGLFLLVAILAFEVPIIGAILIFMIIYFMVLDE